MRSDELVPITGYFLSPFNKSTRRANHFGLSELSSSPSAKNISVFQKSRSGYINSHPVPSRGALRNVPTRGGDAVDADGAPDEGA
jgi:hypothetical protein